MSGKGKKFNAAEKYFNEKEIEYKRKLKVYAGQEVEIANLKNEILKLEEEKLELQNMLDKMLELKEMSVKELKEKIEADKKLLNIQSIFSEMVAISRYFG